MGGVDKPERFVPSGPWRILADSGDRDPCRNLALDEALARAGGPHPTLRIWRNDPSVVLGRAQVAEAEIDMAACHDLGIPVLRRFTGGGTVYHDPGNLNVTIVLGRDDPRLARDPELSGVPGMYRLLLRPLAAAVASLGVPAEATERDVLVRGSKLSGVAGWIGRETLLVHGTLLVDADLATLERVLDGPGAPGDPRWERTRSRRAMVTSLAALLGSSPGGLMERAAQAVVAAVSGGTGRPDTPTDRERAMAAELLAGRYSRPAWHLHGT